MNRKIRNMQFKVLGSFKKCHGDFALAGGTALELYYLNHRFSKDLDFFSLNYEKKEIKKIISAIAGDLGLDILLKDESSAGRMAKILLFEIPIDGSNEILKVDFIEDVIIACPQIRKFKGLPVYSPKDIYYQKICAIAGTRVQSNLAGMEVTAGRNESRDIIDLFYLSQKMQPLSDFLLRMPPVQQRGMINWYRSFSRQEFKLDFLDFEVYSRKLDSVSIIKHLDKEINLFMDRIIS